MTGSPDTSSASPVDAAPRGARVVAVHPERTDDPRVLHWYLGRALALHPGVELPLRQLVDRGVLSDFRLGPDHVATTLAADTTWPQAAPSVRRAVQDVVRADRRSLAADPPARDAFVARIAGEAADTIVAPVATAHGGRIEVLGVTGGSVAVRLHGACHGCPASATTLHGLLQRELDRRLPDLHVTIAPPSPSEDTPRVVTTRRSRLAPTLRRGGRHRDHGETHEEPGAV